MKRSFILLLVVALLATMIPSFALAETATATEAKTEPTIEFSEKEQKVVLVKGGYADPKPEWASLTVEGTVEGTQLQIESSDTKVVSIDAFKEKSAVGEYDQTLYYIATFKTAGEATITATLYDKDDKVIGKAATIAVTVTKKPIEKITVAEDAKSIKIKEGYSKSANLTVEPADAYYAGSLDWSSADESIAVVSKDGKVTGMKAGTTTITAKDPEGKAAEATIDVTVEAKAAEDEDAAPKLSFTTKKFTLKNTDNEFEIEKYLKVDGLSWNDSIVWKSSDPETINVYPEWDYDIYENRYVLSLNKPGSVTITAYSKKFPTASAECEVTYVEEPLKSITFKGQPKGMDEGDRLEDIWDYVITDPSNYKYKLEWSSSDPQVAYVEGSTLQAKKEGTATITASYGDVKESFDITVTGKPVTGVKFAKTDYTVQLGKNPYLEEGRDYTLEPKDHGEENYTLSWTSSDPTVVEVDHGYLSPIKAGSAKITLTVLTADGKSYSDVMTVTVTGAALDDVAFAKESLAVTYYEKADEAYNMHDIDLVIKPSNADITTTWETSDPDVAYVIDERNNGRDLKLVATGYGECEITVTATDGITTKTATLKVTVSKTKTSVKLVLDQTKVNGYIVKGDKNAILLKATNKNNGEAVPVTWTTSNKKVATVSKKGVVRFIAPGKAVITATTTDGKQTATCAIKVRKAKVTKIVRAEKVITVKVGEKAKLGVTVKPVKAYDSSLSFESSDPKTVVVSKKGVVKGLKTGKAVITITAKDGSGVQTRIAVKVVAKGTHNADELIDDTAEELTIDGDLAVDLGDFEDLIIDDLGDDIDGVTEVTIE